MAKRKPKISYPDTKISETLLKFAAPILDDLGPRVSKSLFEKAIKIAFTTWDAVVFADVRNDDRYLRQIRDLTADSAETALLVEGLIRRKRILFGNDQRLMGANSPRWIPA